METLGAATAAPQHVQNKYCRPFCNVLKDSSPKNDSDDGGGGRESAPIALTQPCYPGNSAEELCCFCETPRVCARQRACVCQCIKSEHRFPTPATIKSVTFRRSAGALRSTVEAHSAPGGRFMHSARRNVSNPEVACKGCKGGGVGLGGLPHFTRHA